MSERPRSCATKAEARLYRVPLLVAKYPTRAAKASKHIIKDACLYIVYVESGKSRIPPVIRDGDGDGDGDSRLAMGEYAA